MIRLLRFELLKILKRPFTLVVLLGCLALVLFTVPMSASSMRSYSWTTQNSAGAYNRQDVIEHSGRAAMQLDKQRTARFEGVWNDARIAEMVQGYTAFIENPAHYSDELDHNSMLYRGWTLMDNGMSEADVAAYDAANPIYILKPEIQWGEYQEWASVAMLIEDVLMDEEGNPRPFAEAFPDVKQPATYSYHEGPYALLNLQTGLVGILGLLIALAGMAPLFCEESSRGTEPMLLAAKYGRSKLVYAKLLAGFLFSAACFLLLSLATACLTGLLYGFDGLTMPVQLSYYFTDYPHSHTFLQYIFLSVGLQLLGVLVISAFVMLLSAALRSVLPVVFFGGLFVFLDSILASYARAPYRLIAQALGAGLWSPSALMGRRGTEAALGFLPLPQYAFVPILGAMLVVLGCLFIVHRYRKKTG